MVCLSIPIFGTRVTGVWLTGCTITLASSAAYTYLKLSGTLARKEPVSLPLLGAISDDLELELDDELQHEIEARSDGLQHGKRHGLTTPTPAPNPHHGPMSQRDQGRPSSRGSSSNQLPLYS